MFNFGVAYKPQTNLTLAFDYQRIFYNDVAAISNSNDVDLTDARVRRRSHPTVSGARSGAGFGWDSMDVFKLG